MKNVVNIENAERLDVVELADEATLLAVEIRYALTRPNPDGNGRIGEAWELADKQLNLLEALSWTLKQPQRPNLGYKYLTATA